MNEVKPCPFCGNTIYLSEPDALHPVGRSQEVWSLNCPESAGGCSAGMLGYTKEEAIAKWNQRAPAIFKWKAE